MNKPKKQQNYQSDTFFEAFREIGGKTAVSSKDAIASIAGDMVSQVTLGGGVRQPISGELRPDESLNLEAEIRRRAEEASRRERSHFEHRSRKEKLVYSRKQEEITAQIKAIQEELKKLIEEASGLAQEIEVAVQQVVVDPGVYHINFFDKLRQMIILLRKKVADSKTWMHTANARAKQRSFFWAQVGKSGTKFMLSQERTVSTQAG
ncbi:hypothetical protein IH980_01955 [Patescibacteria group bacterium]|nr:hypothetical protein [Patescibacteria group bacterium]